MTEISMKDIESLYKHRDDSLVIELVLNSMMQLFNSFDPAPFKEKALNSAAEEYIYDAVDEIPLQQKLEMDIYLPESAVSDENRVIIANAIHNHFEYRNAVSERDFIRLMQRGRRALMIGTLILFFTLLFQQILIVYGNSIPSNMAAQALIIIAWVSMWEPIHIFLYDWYPIRLRQRICLKIVALPISVKPLIGAGTGYPE
jgi:hypothetical protein